MSPELTRMQKYGPKTEVWSLGATLYEMRLGFRPCFGGFRHGLIGFRFGSDLVLLLKGPQSLKCHDDLEVST